MRGSARVFGWRAAILILALGSWQWVSHLSTRAFFLFASPTSVASALADAIAHGTYLHDLRITGEEALIGLLLGTAIGSGAGLLFWLSETAAVVARPFILVVSTLPVFAVAPLLIVWFGIGTEMKIALATLATVFVAFNQGYRGAQAVSGEYLDILRGMGASKAQTLVKVIIPGALDWVFSSMRLNVGFSLLGAFIGEFISANEGLGYQIMKASGVYNVPAALAAAFGVAFLALTFDRLAAWVESRRHLLIQLLSVPRVAWEGLSFRRKSSTEPVG